MQLFAGALQYGFSMEAILGQVAAVMGHKATDRLHLIAAPTLVITGDADLLISPPTRTSWRAASRARSW